MISKIFSKNNEKSGQIKELPQISKALVSLFINIARIKDVEKKHIESLVSLFQQSLGYEPSLLYLWEIAKDPYTLREAATIFNKHLTTSDKLKLFLNLFFLAYLEDNYHVLSSLEIIKIVDLMYIEVDLYEQLLDLVEQKTDSFSFDIACFQQEQEQKILHNDVILSKQKDRDYYFKNAELVVLHIRDMIFIGTGSTTNCLYNTKSVEINRFYQIKKDDTFTIVLNDQSTFSIELNDFISLSQKRWNLNKYDYIINEESHQFQVFIDKLDCQIKIKSGFKILFVDDPLKKQSISLDDIILIDPNHKVYSGWELLIGKQNLKSDISTHRELKLIDKEGILILSHEDDQNIAGSILFLNEAILLIPGNNKFKHESILSEKPLVLKINELFTYLDNDYFINCYYQLIKVSYAIQDFVVHEIYHEFSKGQKTALDNLHFNLKRCEMLAIMGPSGSGKTTFLKCLLGEIEAKRISISIDSQVFNPTHSSFRKHIAYVPQDDLLFENLTMYQNLYYCAKIRMPEINNRQLIHDKIKHILSIMGLWERRDLMVGSVNKKSLSGGERKRLNVALELLSDPQILILDEPTSGLSSKDSEKLIETLNSLKLEGKIIIATIHQPNADLFQRFDKLLLLDKGGVQVYFGKTKGIFKYFNEELTEIMYKDPLIQQKKELEMPEYIFDMLEFSEVSNINGISERKYSPHYWKEKYRKNRIYELLHLQTAIQQEDHENKTNTQDEQHSMKQLCKKNYFLFLRNLINKVSNKSNIIINFVASPLLALIISFILRYYKGDFSKVYSFYNNPNIGLFIFISIIVFIFLGMANSVNEIISEKRILNREKKINLKNYEFLNVKIVYLTLFSAIQCLLYLSVAVVVLQISGMFLYYFIFLLLASICGNSIGLLLSALFKDSDSATNLMPYLLIPQILFAGAVISFSDMNPDIKINKKNAVPEFCTVVPSRWIFEGLAVSQAESNYYDRELKNITNEIKSCRNSKQRDILYSKLNNFSKDNPHEKYLNKRLSDWNGLQNGKSLNTGKYQFMSSKVSIFNKLIKVNIFNAIITMLIIILLNLMSLFTLSRIKE